MSMNAADLLRHLQLLFQSNAFVDNGSNIFFEDGHAKIQIRYRQEKPFRAGAIQLPRLSLQIDFSGLDPEQIAGFMQRFDRIYQKGGG
jgi:hypothetical protein